MKKIFIITILCWFFSFENSAQEQEYSHSKIIPPSPTAASLGAYGSINIGYYTGTPDINVPLYEIKTAHHSIPIRMQYNSIGVRVAENAGWTGLGWSLIAGGVITRTIVGLDDFMNYGFYDADAIPQYSTPLTQAQKYYNHEITSGRMDVDPDMFNYNFSGFSGRFVMGKRLDGSVIYMDEKNNLKVQYFSQTDSWTITDASGYKYNFAGREYTDNYFYSSSSQEVADNAPLNVFEQNFGPSNVTAWYLTSVISPQLETINFIYEIKSESIGLVNKTEEQYNLIYLQSSCPNPSSTLQGVYKKFTGSRQVIYDLYLKKIEFVNGSVTFNTSDREDIEYKSAGKPQKLSEMIVRDIQGQQIKKWTFSYSYFNSATKDGRLKLEAITEVGSDGSQLPPHQFSYFSSNSLPNKYSKSIDHWGFYNAELNTSLLPSGIQQNTVNGEYSFFPGANRRPSQNVEHLKPGVLEKITYPTGGSTVLEYELNQYRNLTGNDRFNTVLGGKSVVARPGLDWTYSTASFDIYEPTAVTFAYNYIKAEEGVTYMEGVETEYAFVNKQGVPAPIYRFSNWDPYASNPTEVSSDPAPQYYTAVLEPGHYTISVSNIAGYMTTFAASYYENVFITERSGGGLRVKTIANFENGKKSNVRKFLYGNSTTTGLVLSPVDYDFRVPIQEPLPWENCTVTTNIGDYYARMSYSVFPGGFLSKGTIIGYDKVTEIIGENGEVGSNEYYYYNSQDQNYDDLPMMPTIPSPLNGRPAIIISKNTAGDIVKKVDYNYETKAIDYLRGVKVFSPIVSSLQAESNYFFKYYYLYSYWTTLNSEEEDLRTPAGALVRLKKYFYNNNEHREVTSTEVTMSNGKKLITKFKRPGDYSLAGATSFTAQMKQKNIVAPVIEEQALTVDGTTSRLIAGKFTKYKLVNNNSFEPDVIYKLATNTPSSDISESNISSAGDITLHSLYKPEVQFSKYNQNGGLGEWEKINDNKNCYYWGYVDQYPIAQVVNAAVENIFHTSFEDSEGNSTEGDSKNGKKSRTGGYTKALFNLTNGQYLLTYWQKSGSTWSLQTSTITVSGNAYTINLTGQVDEVRFYPSTALMTTYTYEPLIGMTSQTDANNRTIYYEYDGFGRLKLIKDQSGNIIKTMDYKYKTN